MMNFIFLDLRTELKVGASESGVPVFVFEPKEVSEDEGDEERGVEAVP